MPCLRCLARHSQQMGKREALLHLLTYAFMLQGLLCCFTLGDLQLNAWVGRSLIMKDSVRIDNRFVPDGILGQRYECESTKASGRRGFSHSDHQACDYSQRDYCSLPCADDCPEAPSLDI